MLHLPISPPSATSEIGSLATAISSSLIASKYPSSVILAPSRRATSFSSVSSSPAMVNPAERSTVFPPSSSAATIAY